jgi:hypothetical protein
LATRATAAATTGTIWGDARPEFLIAQLEDELVFKGGRDVMGVNQGHVNAAA